VITIPNKTLCTSSAAALSIRRNAPTINERAPFTTEGDSKATSSLAIAPYSTFPTFEFKSNSYLLQHSPREIPHLRSSSGHAPMKGIVLEAENSTVRLSELKPSREKIRASLCSHWIVCIIIVFFCLSKKYWPVGLWRISASAFVDTTFLGIRCRKGSSLGAIFLVNFDLTRFSD
jgi:hypothetical protein